MARLEDLGLPDDRIDDRWTLTKLYHAGYEEAWSRTCRTCGDQIVCYTRAPRTGGTMTLILNDIVLTPHRCDGT